MLHRHFSAVREIPDIEGLFRCRKSVAEREGFSSSIPDGYSILLSEAMNSAGRRRAYPLPSPHDPFPLSAPPHRAAGGCSLKSHVDWFDMLVSRSARSDCTTTNRRRPIVVVTICPAPINSYSFVRPKPVTSHASSIVQVSRWANGIVLGSAACGADRLTCDCCPSVFSRRLYLTWHSYSHKARQDES